jgi:hypothetical protein
MSILSTVFRFFNGFKINMFNTTHYHFHFYCSDRDETQKVLEKTGAIAALPVDKQESAATVEQDKQQEQRETGQGN